MTYADYKLGKAIHALSESYGRNRDWLGSAEVFLFIRLPDGDVPSAARKRFVEFQEEVARLQRKYTASQLHIPVALLTDDEVAALMKLFVDLVASWPGSTDTYR